MKSKIWLLAISAVILTAIAGIGWNLTRDEISRRGPTREVATFSDSSRNSLAAGAEIFAKNCAACHGHKGVGKDPAKPKGGFMPDGGYLAPALNGTGHTWHHSRKTLIRIVTDGSIDPKSAMIGFRSRLDDAEIREVVSYVQSLWPEEIRRLRKKLY